MAFIDAYSNIKKTLKMRKPNKIDGHLAIQLNLTDEDANGIMYIEVADGKLNIEPYDYCDNDAVLSVSSEDFIDIMNSKLDFDKAVEDEKLIVYGNYDRALAIKTLIRKPVTRKPAAKKTTVTKKPANKTSK